MKRLFLILALILIGIATGAGVYLYRVSSFQPTPTIIQQGVQIDEETIEQIPESQPPIEETEPEPRESIEVVAQGLEIPWGIVFLPDGRMLVTERPGRLQLIGETRTQIPVEGIAHIEEGGLLGVALHPNFAQNRFIYLYMTTSAEGGLINRIERYRLENDTLSDRTVIIDNIPGAIYHDGGGIAFGPDGHLYLTTGDARVPANAQDRESLSGKTLRLRDDGSVPNDNPFSTAIYSWGHRNAQGITWDSEGRMWQTEHGRSGVLSGLDELNQVNAGDNYGWPTIQGDETQTGMQAPLRHSGPRETWAPAGLAFVPSETGGSLFFAGLRGESLYQATIDQSGNVTDLRSHFRGDFGRLRAVVLGPDNALYVSTSNRDGRGTVRDGDDKIIRFALSLFDL